MLLHGSFASPIAIVVKSSGIIEMRERGRHQSEALESAIEYGAGCA